MPVRNADLGYLGVMFRKLGPPNSGATVFLLVPFKTAEEWVPTPQKLASRQGWQSALDLLLDAPVAQPRESPEIGLGRASWFIPWLWVEKK